RPEKGSEDHHVHRHPIARGRHPARPLRPGRDRVRAARPGAARRARAALDAGQPSRLQLALASVPHKRDVGCCGEWTAINGADW
ncbi:hypothetical protein ACS0Y6_34720, partial [Burkholderia gladioli]|uniref:hypothetical protein n=1 Tax=Burkholderia gladioli TaxID=28095 RepID=UPI003F79EF0A